MKQIKVDMESIEECTKERMKHEIKIEQSLNETIDYLQIELGGTYIHLFNHASGHKSISIHRIDEDLDITLFHGKDEKICKSKKNFSTFARTEVKVI